jgi:hypothetical protein
MISAMVVDEMSPAFLMKKREINSMSKPLRLQVFDQAFNLVKNPETWCRGFAALDAKGRFINYNRAEAVSFCSLGALAVSKLRLTGQGWTEREDLLLRPLTYALNAVSRELMGEKWSSIDQVNDHLPHETVIHVWEKARERVYNEQAD